MAAPTVSLCLVLLASFIAARAQSPMEHEPVEHLKAHLPKRGDDISGKLEVFLQAPPKELQRKTAKMENNLRKVLKNEAHVSAFLVKGSTVLAQKTAAGIQFNSTFLLPHAVLLPILSTTLPILLEGYKPDLLTSPIGAVLKGKHREKSDVKDYLSLSLHDLATKLPQSGGSVDLDSPTLLSEINRRGKAAFVYLSVVLESVAEDAWKDALISVMMDLSVFGDNQQMLTNFKDLARYAEALGSDIINFYEVSKSDLYPVDGGHFLYGWWFNCPHGGGRGGGRESRCLASFLPSNTMAVLHTVIRLYTIPKLGLHLLVANTDKSAGAPRTLSDVLAQDKMIWNALYSVVDPSSVPKKQEEEKKEGEQKDESQMKEDRDGGKEAPTEPPPLAAEESQPLAQETAEPPAATEEQGEDDRPEPAVEKEESEAPTQPPVTAEKEEVPTQEVPTEPPPVTEGGEPPTESPQAGESEPPSEEVPTQQPPEKVEDELEMPPSAEPTATPLGKEKKTAKETTPTPVAEDEVVGESTPKKKPTATGGGQQAPPPTKRGAEDEVIEKPRNKPGRGEVDLKGKPLLVWVIYMGWPFAVFLFYTILSHVWAYWFMHLLWLACSSVVSGVHLPRPKTAKED